MESLCLLFNFIRPVLCVVLVFYMPIKIGVSLDLVAKGCTPEEVRKECFNQILHIKKAKFIGVVILPFRIGIVMFLSLWLFVDRAPFVWIFIFFLTVVPVCLK